MPRKRRRYNSSLRTMSMVDRARFGLGIALKKFPKYVETFRDNYKTSVFNPFHDYDVIEDSVKSVIKEIPLHSLQSAVNTGFEYLDSAVGVVRTPIEGALEESLGLWDDATALARIMGFTTDDNIDKIEDVQHIKNRLMDEFGLNEEEANRKALKISEQDSEISRPTPITNPHHDELTHFQDSSKHHQKRDPMHEGSHHVYPEHGNDLIGYDRSVLDSAPGSRSVHVPYLEQNIRDRPHTQHEHKENKNTKMDAEKFKELQKSTFISGDIR